MNVGVNSIMAEVNEKFDDSISDFFDRIMLSSRLKLSLLKKHPGILAFLKSAYFENDEDVKEDVRAIFTSEAGQRLREKIAFDGVDLSRFKEGTDPKLVMTMIDWLGEGFMNKASANMQTEAELDYLYGVFEECMQLLKSNFYK